MQEIRALRSEDMRDSLRLSQFAFQYELTKEEENERLARAKPEQTWGAFIDGQLAAKLTVLPLQTFVGGRVFEMGGVAGVATWPEHRRGGLVAKLISHSLRVMKDRGQLLSFLHPFSFAFYRKFGWEHYVDVKAYELSVSQLPRFPQEKGKLVRTADTGTLNEIYEAYAMRYNGTLKRSPDWWAWDILRMKAQGCSSMVYTDAEGAPRGYILYKVKERVLSVAELVCLDEEARRALWSFIANHDSMIQKVTVKTEAGDRFPFMLPDPKVKQEIVAYFMARIVDVKPFLEQYPYREDGEGRFRLHVTDEHAAWNTGIYEVMVKNGAAEVSFHFSEGGTSERAVDGAVAAGRGETAAACDIQTLSAMLMGYQRPRALQEIGRLQVQDAGIQLLEALIPERTTYLPDFF